MGTPVLSYLQKLDRTSIRPERLDLLQKISAWIDRRRQVGAAVDCVFVCTHNSRRSQFAQVWGHVLGKIFLPECRWYSAGTEVTACHPHVLDALRRAGFLINADSPDQNPVIEVRQDVSAEPIRLRSKRYDDSSLPSSGFLAIMVCGHAAENCPVVPGADDRCEIPFVDPKVSDGTGNEAATYDASCAEIATELSWVLRNAAAGLR